MNERMWSLMIDFIAEQLFNEVEDFGHVYVSRFLMLAKKESDYLMKKPTRKLQANYYLTNVTGLFMVEVHDKNTPEFRKIIEVHCIDKVNNTLAGWYRNDVKALSYLRHLQLSEIASRTPREKEENRRM